MKEKRIRAILQVGFFSIKNIVKIAIYVAIACILINISKAAFSFGYAVFHQEAVAEEYGKDVIVEIPVGATTYDAAKILKEAGLIENSELFLIQEYLSGYHGKIQPGTYTLNTVQAADEIIAVLCSDAPEEQK